MPEDNLTIKNKPMKNILRCILISAITMSSLCTNAQRKEYTPSQIKGTGWNTPGNLNPIIPGYFADPTIRKFGDTYYIYATTDGTGNGYGPAQVWVSKDFRNWKNIILNWPTTEVVWAPDVVQKPDGTFRYFYCEPCNINIGESTSPLGPWHNILGKTDAVMVPDRYVHNVITLDPQLFRDDDGEEYLYFTTWGIYDGFGCGVAQLDKNWKIEEADLANLPATNKKPARDARFWNENRPFPIEADRFFKEKRLIPNTELKDIFEAPFIFKRNGIYYFTYSSGSCHTDTYRVQYATSTDGPMGPFTYQGELLTTTTDGTVHGPGHHSILQDGDHYYIVYHRHDIAKAIHGFNRQVCMDELLFNDDGTIQRVSPTHNGLMPESLKKAKRKIECQNIALSAKVTCSSYYNELFVPNYITDDNNATLWKAKSCNEEEWVCIDLGSAKRFNQIWTQFEYATFFYQYIIETSTDGQTWHTYADRTGNTNAGSPMIDESDCKARFIRIKVTDTQKNGHFPAIWNVKVFHAGKKNNPKSLLPSTEGMDYAAVEKAYPNLHRKDVEQKDRIEAKGRDYVILDITADHQATPEGWSVNGAEDILIEPVAGKWAFYFDGQTTLRSTFSMPKTMTYNAPYTIAAWIYNPSVEGLETILDCTESRNDLATIELRQGTDAQNGLVAHNASFENFGDASACRMSAGSWHHWVVTYDGYMERIYLDGKLLREKNSFLMIRPQGNMTIGGGHDGSHRFTGYLNSIKMFDKAVSEVEIGTLFNAPCLHAESRPINASDLVVSAEAITPTLAKASITDANGKPFRSGRIRYNGQQSASFITAIPSDKVISIDITDDSGQLISNIKKEIAVNSKAFDTFSKTEETTLSATTPNFNDDPAANGAMLLTEADGNFVMQCRVTDMEGKGGHRTPSYNEGGIIIYADARHFMHLGVFPNYNCGDMLTLVTPRDGRPQFPNQKGWRYDEWLQLERNGDMIYARTSADGNNWTEMPGSPISVARLTGSNDKAKNNGTSGAKTLKLGMYQTTYTDNKSWVKFSDLNIWKRK